MDVVYAERVFLRVIKNMRIERHLVRLAPHGINYLEVGPC